MAGIVTKNEEFGQRVCILFEFLQGKPVFESYKNLCKKIGDEAIEYKEFDFWFHRFANGKLDLNYDKSLEPDKRPFSDIPIHIISDIVDFLDPMDRFIVRKVNQNLRKLVDRKYKSVHILCHTKAIQLHFANEWIQYMNGTDGCVVKCKGKEKRVEGGGYMEIAFNDLSCILKVPDLQLDMLALATDSEHVSKKFSKKCFKHLKTSLKTLSHQLHVKTFVAASNRWKHFISVLRYFEAGSLSGIALKCPKSEKDQEKRAMSKLFKMDQWKHIKIAVMGRLNAIPIDNISHLAGASFSLASVTATDVREVQEMFFKPISLQVCCLKSSVPINVTEIEKALGPSYPTHSGIRHYPIPFTNEFLGVYIHEDEIIFKSRC